MPVKQLLAEMKSYIQKHYFNRRITQKNFWDKVYILNKEERENNDNNIGYFRNKSAHLYTFSQVEADKCKTILLDVLNEWTQMIK